MTKSDVYKKIPVRWEIAKGNIAEELVMKRGDTEFNKWNRTMQTETNKKWKKQMLASKLVYNRCTNVLKSLGLNKMGTIYIPLKLQQILFYNL